MSELVIHIGDCKAGSTAIQKALHSGDWTAEGGKSLAYAGTGLRMKRDFANHHPLANALFQKAKFRRAPHLYEMLGREWAGCEADALVVSSERFEFVDPARLQGMLAEKLPDACAGLRLIVYVRPHAERLVSGYGQQIKQGVFTGTLEQFHDRTLGKRRFHFAERLGRWRNVFGDRLTVRPMIRSQLHRNCAAHDFLALATGTETARLAAASEANIAISLADLVLIRDFRLAAGRGRRIDTINRKLVDCMEESPVGDAPRLRLHRDLAERILRDYADDAARLDAEFFTGPVMSDALAAAVEMASEHAQSLDAATVLPAELHRLNRIWVQTVLATQPRPGRRKRSRRRSAGKSVSAGRPAAKDPDD
ncbi:MAG: hypothetical protein D6754_01285 [Alphaproteobacteria bacterium]|nr:MAG: hypothetical protein D6754_01285 [Alphaproteobacteria bacterium]